MAHHLITIGQKFVRFVVVLSMLLGSVGNALPVRAAEPAPTQVVQPTDTPIATPTATETQTETPTPTLAPTLPITPTATPVPTVTPTSIVTPTETVSNEASTPGNREKVVADSGVSLKVDISPAIYIPGKTLRLSWKIRQYKELAVAPELQVVIHAPQGLKPLDPDVFLVDGSWVVKDAQAKDRIEWEAAPEAVTPFMFGLDLLLNGQLVDQQAVLVDSETSELQSGKAGKVSGFGGAVSLEAADTALDETLVFNMRNPSPHKQPPVSLSGHPVEIIAVGKESGQDVKKFKQPLKLTFQYDEKELAQMHWAAEDLKVYYYDDDMADWYPLPSVVDPISHTLSAQTDHLTVFDYKAATWQAYTLPTVDSFKVSGFTGAATYGMSFWMPPGPGGMQPSLSLSYNSQVIDEASAYSQASIVGMGWSMETGSITRNMHETNSVETDDTFFISSGGVSGLLLPISFSDPVTTYNTADQSYSKVEFNSTTNIWTVWTKDGTKYIFDKTAKTNKTVSCATANNIDFTWQWAIGSVTNIYDQSLTYTYTLGTKPNCANQIAIYPGAITYPNNQYRVFFHYENRLDYQDSWTTNDSTVFYSTKRVQKLSIDQKVSGSWTPIRRYAFSYAPDTTNDTTSIMHRFKWSKGGKTSTLLSVQEKSGDYSQSLPATTFTYDDLHLTKVDNGQGGQVQIQYERWTYFDDINKSQRFLYTNFGQTGQECGPGYGTAWQGVSGAINYVRCDGSWNILQVGQDGQGGAIGERSIPEHIVKPGGRYVYYIHAKAQTGTSSVYWGFKDRGNGEVYILGGGLPQLGSNFEGREGAIEMPSYFDPSNTYLRLDCDDCLIDNLQFALFPQVFRVITQTVTDLVTNQSSLTSYKYDNASPNTAFTSEAVASGEALYTSAQREFRGHSMVQVTNPAGLTSMTWYYQNDNFKGRPYRTLEVGNLVSDEMETLNLSKWTLSPTGSTAIDYIYGTDYDFAAKTTNSSANWNVDLMRSNADISNGEIAVAHIRLSGSDAQAKVGLSSASNKFFGLIITPVNGKPTAKLFYNTGGTDQTGGTMISGDKFKLDKWYVVMLMADSAHGFVVRIWQLDDPNIFGAAMVSSGFSAENWKYKQSVISGSLWLDGYFEGKLYSENNTRYAATLQYESLDSGSGPNIPNILQPTGKRDLNIVWTRVMSTTSQMLDGTSWTGTRTLMEYNTSDQGGTQSSTQYGNLSRQVQEYWTGSAWVDYQVSITRFNPYTSSTRYLVGLPAISSLYKCNGEINGGCSGTASNSTLLSSHWYLYDGASSFSSAPSVGKLTAERSLLTCTDSVCANTAQRFTDVTYGYDSWGNRVTTTTYTNEGTYSALASGVAQTTSVCYGSSGTVNGYTCADDGYHTYPLWQRNALGQMTSTTYDYAKSVPLSGTDPNNAVTTVAYDIFGRPTSVTKPGDSSASVQISYHIPTSPFSNNPFWTSFTQQIDDSTTLVVRKFYNGLGQLIQTQTANAQLVNGTRDVVSDIYYDSAGRAYRQSVPYEAATSSGYKTPDTGQAFTQTAFDPLGRATSVTAPGSSPQTTSYAIKYDTNGKVYYETCVTDPASHTTCSRQNALGQTTEVHPATGPWTQYAYNTQGLLSTVNQMNGSSSFATTTLAYDLAGRKTSMDDPDMGIWAYTYNAMGSLISQKDAKGQMSLLNYDLLGRLTAKSSPDLVNTTFSDDFTTKNTSAWVWSINQSVPYPDSGNAVVQNAGTGSNWNANFYRGSLSLSNGKALRTRFKVDSLYTKLHLAIENTSGGNWRFGVIADSGKLYVEYNNNAGFVNPSDLLASIETNIWYVLQIVVDDVNGFTVQVYKENDPSVQGSYRFGMATGKSWRFRQWNWLGNAYMDDYTEFNTNLYRYDQGTNGIGQRTGMIDPSGNTTWTYDNRGRLTSETKTITGSGTFKTEWGYNTGDMLNWMKYPEGNTGLTGEQLYYEYYNQGSVKDIQSDLHNGTLPYYYLEQAIYDAAGRLEQADLGARFRAPNPVLRNDPSYYLWNTTNMGGRMSSNVTQRIAGGTQTRQSLSYQYNSSGNISSIVDNLASETQNFAYDVINRLIGVSGAVTESYQYDTYGRLSDKTGQGTYSYSATRPGTGCQTGSQSAIVHAVSGVSSNPVKSYAYDCNGNMTQRYIGSNPPTTTYTFGYDAENRMVSATSTSGVNNSYVYDGNGARVKSVVGGVTTVFIGGYYEWTSSGTTKYYGLGVSVSAMRKDNGVTSTLYWVLGDHLGSVSIILDENGNSLNPLQNVKYLPWGGLRSGSVQLTLTMKGFTGQYRDSYINLVWMNSRWYDPELGRWTQPDVIVPANQGVQGFDRYGYVSNSPVSWLDPSGHGRESTDCGPDGIFCDTMGKRLSNSEIYDVLLAENWIKPLPDASIIFNAVYNSMSRVNGVLANYEKTRKFLFTKYGWDAFGRFFDQTGKLFDNVFMAMVAMGEFASKTGEAFLESIEALSNQYYGDIVDNPGPMQCSGNCSFTQQLLWATQFEAWYNSEFFDKYVKTGAWMGQLDTAQKAVNRYSNGEDTSWFWGNVTKDGQTKYALTITPVLSDYPEKPWFIVYSYEIK